MAQYVSADCPTFEVVLQPIESKPTHASEVAICLSRWQDRIAPQLVIPLTKLNCTLSWKWTPSSRNRIIQSLSEESHPNQNAYGWTVGTNIKHAAYNYASHVHAHYLHNIMLQQTCKGQKYQYTLSLQYIWMHTCVIVLHPKHLRT